MTTSLGPGPGPSDWLALPKGDASQYSQNSADHSIVLPCQNRGLATTMRTDKVAEQKQEGQF